MTHVLPLDSISFEKFDKQAHIAVGQVLVEADAAIEVDHECVLLAWDTDLTGLCATVRSSVRGLMCCAVWDALALKPLS